MGMAAWEHMKRPTATVVAAAVAAVAATVAAVAAAVAAVAAALAAVAAAWQMRHFKDTKCLRPLTQVTLLNLYFLPYF